MPDLSNYMPDLSTTSQRRGAAISLRGLARILLVSWLFTLLVCFYSDFSKTSVDAVKDIPVHEHNGLSNSNSNNAQDTDTCCTIDRNLPIFFNMSDIKSPLQNLMYVLFPYIFIIQIALLVTIKGNLFCTDPPDKLHHLLSANLLWPNAPPR